MRKLNLSRVVPASISDATAWKLRLKKKRNGEKDNREEGGSEGGPEGAVRTGWRKMPTWTGRNRGRLRRRIKENEGQPSSNPVLVSQ